MFCNKCGNKLSASVKFCNKCGNSISIPKEQEAERYNITKKEVNEVDLKKHRNEILIYFLLFLLGMIDIASSSAMEQEYGVISLYLGTGLGNIFNSYTLSGIVVTMLDFIFSLSVIWLVVAVVKNNKYSKLRRGGYVPSKKTIDFNFKRYFKIIFTILGLSFFVLFFIMSLSEEDLISNIFLSLWIASIMGGSLALLLTIFIKWSKEIYYKTSDKQQSIQQPKTNISVKKYLRVLNKKTLLILGSIPIIFIVILWIVGVAFVEPTEDSNKNISTKELNTKKISASIVNIYCSIDDDYNSEYNNYGGSGTIISEDGLIITNSHVIPQDETMLQVSDLGCLVYIPNATTGSAEEIYYANPVVYEGLSEEYDLAYLKIYEVYVDEDGWVWGEYPKKFIAYDINAICNEDNIILGEKIRVYGYPLMSGGMSLTITDGIISSLPGEGLILTSAKIDEGNSGGLAVDNNGCMIGIPSSVMLGEYENMGVIISKKLVEKFQKKADIENY